MREFIKLDEDAIFPLRSTKGSAGYDLFSLEDYTLKAGYKVDMVRTGIGVKLNEDEFLSLHIRSSIATKQKLMLINNIGIIDSDYFGNSNNGGEILLPLVNLSDKNVVIRKGEKIAQGIIQKYLCVSREDKVVNTRCGGFGSTD